MPRSAIVTGGASTLAHMQALVDLVGTIEVRLDELIEADDGRFVACTRIVGPGEAGEAPYTRTFAVVHRLRGGLLVEADCRVASGACWMS